MDENTSLSDKKKLKTSTDHKLIINPLFFLVVIFYGVSRWVVDVINAAKLSWSHKF